MIRCMCSRADAIIIIAPLPLIRDSSRMYVSHANMHAWNAHPIQPARTVRRGTYWPMHRVCKYVHITRTTTNLVLPANCAIPHSTPYASSASPQGVLDVCCPTTDTIAHA